MLSVPWDVMVNCGEQGTLTPIKNWKTTARPLGKDCRKLKTRSSSKRQYGFDNIFIFNLVDGACAVNNPLDCWDYEKPLKKLTGMYPGLRK